MKPTNDLEAARSRVWAKIAGLGSRKRAAEVIMGLNFFARGER